MPALEKLVLSHSGNQGGEPTDILPFAPRLTTLCIHGIASISLREETELPSLTEFVWNSRYATLETAWTILRRAAATLTRVVLAPRSSTMATAATVATPILHLPRIRELTLASRFPDMTEALASFAFPGLTTLVLMRNVLAPNILSFLDSLCGTVTCIDLFLHLDANESAILSNLCNVTQVGFGCTPNNGVEYRVNDAFFSQLCECDALRDYSWPKLTSLVFDQCGEFDASDGGGEGLLRFIRSRTAPNLNDKSTPRRLQRVALGAKGVPTWLSAEVDRIMCTG
ncbi:hypothetical protein EXIGLDRAFT_773681 [Exidia glandulosa HHB12029]|uniref:RNI-like protein n=1 Tax=Exidia glandulosa HHB12029 TaxID=1314781 RepID=A0A165EPK5_EXIGL|nr:hypothetical protein EXIGLDRAFT_773681 [Exidia glandulosa HHB12029]